MSNRVNRLCKTILIALQGYDELFVSAEIAASDDLCIVSTTRTAVKSNVGSTLFPTASLNDNFFVNERTRIIISDGNDQSVAAYIDPRIRSLIQSVRMAGGTVSAPPATAWQLSRLGIYLSPEAIISRGQLEPGKLEST